MATPNYDLHFPGLADFDNPDWPTFTFSFTLVPRERNIPAIFSWLIRSISLRPRIDTVVIPLPFSLPSPPKDGMLYTNGF